jgi:hypothetical protein
MKLFLCLFTFQVHRLNLELKTQLSQVVKGEFGGSKFGSNLSSLKGEESGSSVLVLLLTDSLRTVSGSK